MVKLYISRTFPQTTNESQKIVLYFKMRATKTLQNVSRRKHLNCNDNEFSES